MNTRSRFRLGGLAILMTVSSCTGGEAHEEDPSAVHAGVGAPSVAGDGVDTKVVAAPVAKPGLDLPAPFKGDPVSSQTTTSGLVIADYVLGDGPEAAAGWDVSVHYSGYLEDGRMFDSSLKRGRPFSFPVGKGRAIEGWDEGVLGMKVGGKRRLEVPPELGYGAKKAGKIPPNSRLIFTMDLVSATPPLPDPRGDEAFEGKPMATTKLDGGLVVADYVEGAGEAAKKGDTVLVHYTGRLKDGTVFGSSVPHKQPISFVLGSGRVIKGWEVGIEGMKPGGLRKLTIPAELGYGERGKGEIPGNARLVFTVELMAIR